ncbi:MAG: nicotinate phosphoribosyltransferase [Gammaproteobacteria bacterium]
MLTNMILNADSYKASHFLQYPEGITHISCYIESRGGEYAQALFFGLQMFLKEYLSKPITQQDILQAEEVFTTHGLPFYKDGWQYILDKHQGYMPVQIEAIPEGTLLPTHNVMLQMVNTDPQCYWLTTYLETALLRAVWYPTTVATLSWYCKQTIQEFLESTADSLAGLPTKLHDFGSRGASSLETASIGGCAHLVNFIGSDTIVGALYARKYYAEPMAAFSIPAAEHSTITVWGKDHEKDAYENMITKFSGKGKWFAVVSDSYDLFNAVDHIWGEQLKEKVMHNGGTLVIRPDSGDPTQIVCTTLEKLMQKFGYTTNAKGFKLLPPYIRVLQGDEVSPETIRSILFGMQTKGLSADNIAFGMGGALLQKVHRDTLEFAMKASAAQINGIWQDVYKDPVTGPRKVSKKGRLALIKRDDQFKTIRVEELADNTNILVPVFMNGKILREYTFSEIRERVNNQ